MTSSCHMDTKATSSNTEKSAAQVLTISNKVFKDLQELKRKRKGRMQLWTQFNQALY